MQAVVHGAFSLLRFTVPSEYPAKTSHPPHPGYFLRPLNIGSSALSLTYAHRPAPPVGQGLFQHRTHSHRLRVISPSLISFGICWRALALAISLVSLGSQQTLEASLFWSLSILMVAAAAAKGCLSSFIYLARSYSPSLPASFPWTSGLGWKCSSSIY